MLRISPKENYEYKKAEYENMEMVSALGIDAGESIISLPSKQVYVYGVEAGTILRKLHSIPATEGIGRWDDYFNKKMNQKIENYKNCPLKYEGGEAFIAYIEEHRHLLKGRPMTYQHGDYHIGNLMIDGYFDGDVPKSFWDLLAMYISSNILSSLPWAIPFGQKEIDVMVNLAKNVLDWYDGMKNTVPK